MNLIENVQLSSFTYHTHDSRLAKGKQNTKHTDGWTLVFPFNSSLPWAGGEQSEHTTETVSTNLLLFWVN